VSAATFGWNDQPRLERSRTFLAQADRVSFFRAAARSYRAFLSGVTRISKRSLSGFSMGGLPLGRFLGCSMSLILVRTNNLHKRI
jgi:hypothetical protein